ncbi:MAG: hypothetical protein ACRC67_06835 [Inquilinus sp.]|uniref:hypothetical protein n=1 Tax=Inquilinus sp. TaxID=1932117 RepID=UPI003F358901
MVIATSIAAIAGALILYGAGGEAATQAAAATTQAAAPSNNTLIAWLSGQGLRTLLFIVQVAALAAAAYAAEILRETEVTADWLTKRRAAEQGRAELFDHIMSVAAEKGLETKRRALTTS